MLDYLPASIMCYGRFMLPVKFILEILWNLLLRQYSVVIKPAANFGFHGNNSVIYRFWPTINFNQKEKLIKPNKTVTYLGNLGFVYNYDAVIQKAREYKNRGYEINFYADGPNVNKLPTWIKKKQFHSEKELKNILIENEIFLVAGTIHTDECSFPSKVWNSLSLGREIVPCGFSKNMLNELELVKRSINQDNLEALSIYIKNIAFTNKNLT
jgi:hypothetical protein